MADKKQTILSTVMIWAMWQGMVDITDDEEYRYHTDSRFEKDGKIIGFITEFDREGEELRNEAVKAKEFCDYVYIVVDDIKKSETIKNSTPTFCGILCYSNPYGLGYIFQVLREPQLI